MSAALVRPDVSENMSGPLQARQDEGTPKRRRTVPFWLVLLIAAALGIALALLFPVMSRPPM